MLGRFGIFLIFLKLHTLPTSLFMCLIISMIHGVCNGAWCRCNKIILSKKLVFLLKNVLPFQPSRMASADFIRRLKKVTMAQNIAAVSKPEGRGQFGPPPMTNYS